MFRMWLGVYGVANETRENDRQVKSAVETVLNLGKIATSILGEIERMIGPSKCGLQIAEKGKLLIINISMKN